jgi:hypothetical protein
MQNEDFDLEIRKLLLSLVPVFLPLEEVSEDVKSRAVQISDVRSPRQLNFAWWCLLFVGPKLETYFMSLFLCLKFLRQLLDFLKICTPLVKRKSVIESSN